MKKRNITGRKQALAEISQARDVFTKLDDFFTGADEDICNDPDDPRDGIGRFSGLNRLMLLIPCVINRLEEDISGNIEGENLEPVKEGLYAIIDGLNSVLTYYLQDDVDLACNLLGNAMSKIVNISNKEPQSCVRFLNDIARIAPDFEMLLHMFEGFRENKRTRPDEPETDESWLPESWLDYYREKARLEEPLFAMVAAHGLTEASLEKGMILMMEESEHMDKRMGRQITSYELEINRDAAFSPEYPQQFLDLPEIPDVKDDESNEDDDYDGDYDGDYDVSNIEDLHYDKEYEEEPPEPWASSLPELENWNKHKSDSTFEDSDMSGHKFENDPVYILLTPFVNSVIECQKDDFLQQSKESDEDRMRSPLEHYIVILALKPQARIASCGVVTGNVGHEAPRKGVYLFAIECLEMIAEAIEKFSQQHLYHLASEARTINKQIEEILVEI
ncbi:MAG: hypothetical protein ACUZ8E_11140 [Candidatus Anammoxibacter sp.]